MPYGEKYSEKEFDRDKIPTAIPPGIYRVRVADVSKERVEDNAAPMANVRFAVTGGDFEGQVIFRRFVIPIEDDECKAKGGIPDAKRMQYMRFLGPFLDAVGAAKKGLSPDAWIGNELWIRVKNEEFNGAIDAKIDGFYAEKPAAAR